jgi:hypothetical protein
MRGSVGLGDAMVGIMYRRLPKENECMQVIKSSLDLAPSVDRMHMSVSQSQMRVRCIILRPRPRFEDDVTNTSKWRHAKPY